MITSGTAFQFIRDQFNGLHDLEGDVIKLALFNTLATIDRTTVDLYSSLTNECSGSGYTTGGETLTLTAVFNVGFLPGMDIADIQWTGVDLGGSVPAQAIKAGVIYNTSQSGKIIAVIDFGTPIILNSNDLTINWPDATNPANAFIVGCA